LGDNPQSQSQSQSWTVLKTSVQFGLNVIQCPEFRLGDLWMKGQTGFFDVEDRLKRLSDLDTPKNRLFLV
jgi:hypothetical protein